MAQAALSCLPTASAQQRVTPHNCFGKAPCRTKRGQETYKAEPILPLPFPWVQLNIIANPNPICAGDNDVKSPVYVNVTCDVRP